jgi:hypothetical protein
MELHSPSENKSELIFARALSWWPTDARPPTFGLDAHQLQSLLWNAKPVNAHAAPMWRPITPAG